jgi:hypothetical protein
VDPGLLELETSMEEIVEEGVARLKTKNTWKIWQWSADGQEFFEAEAFRQHITVRGLRGRCVMAASAVQTGAAPGWEQAHVA